jgi:hypothetical protein
MTEKYSKEKFDGTVVHYESREEMDAATERSAVAWIAFIAFFIGGAVAFLTLSTLGINWLPKWAKFITIITSSVVFSYLGWRLGRAILIGIGLLLCLIFLLVLGSLVWGLVSSI